MTRRLRSWVLAFLVALDQLAHVVLAAPKYIIFGGPTPNPDETVSGKVGRRAIAGARWARMCELVINLLFRILTGERDHCRNVALREASRSAG